MEARPSVASPETPTSAAAVPFQRLPSIDYTRHPLYGRVDPSVGFMDRVVGYLRYGQVVVTLVALRFYHLWKRRPWTETKATPQLDALRRDGVVPQQLTAEARTAIATRAEPYFKQLETRRAGVPLGKRTYPDGQVDTTREVAPELFEAVESALEDAGILPSVRAYLGCQAEVRKVTMQMNDEWDGYWREHFESRGLAIPDTAFFHVDNTYGVVKVILYMSEVTETSGPFAYVRGTHRLHFGPFEGLLLRATDIWLDNWSQHHGMLLTLPKALRKRAKFGDDIPEDSAWGQWLLDHEERFTSLTGDLLLFDVLGIHRGGMVERGERRIIQIMMR